MRRVIVESPFAGDTQKNVAYARQCMKDCINRGEVPFASHLLFPQFLDDTIPEQRKLGIEMGYDFWEKSDKIIFYTDLGMSDGMMKALAKAFLDGKPYEKRSLQVKTTALPDEVQKFAPPARKPVDLDALARTLSDQQNAERPQVARMPEAEFKV